MNENVVRAKFKCIQRDIYGNVKLSAVSSDDPESENKKFWDATPSGTVDMCINVEDTREFFQLGKEYYIDFTEADSG